MYTCKRICSEYSTYSRSLTFVTSAESDMGPFALINGCGIGTEVSISHIHVRSRLCYISYFDFTEIQMENYNFHIRDEFIGRSASEGCSSREIIGE